MVENGSFVDGCEDGEKFLHSCFAPIERGFLGASRSKWYFDLIRILETCQLFYLKVILGIRSCEKMYGKRH